MTQLKALILTSLLSLIYIENIYANSSVEDVLNEINDDMRKTRIKEGFNSSGGVSIVSSSNIHASNKLKTQWMKERLEQKEKGYISTYSHRAKELSELKDTVEYKYAASLKNNDKKSSTFRKSIQEISMGYNYSPVPEQYIVKVYGFAASNTYNKGWSGVVEFFKAKTVGVCAFTENNIVITKQSAKVDEDIVTYDINGKVTVTNIEGNPESGFLYQIDWFGDNFFRTLECSHPKFSKNILNDVYKLARVIDEK